MRQFRLRHSLVLFVSVGLIGCTESRTGQPSALTLNKLQDDLYEIEGHGGNVALYVTNEGAILVDDKYEQDFDALVAIIKSVTSQPVRYVFNTHHHGDHTGGNARFLRTAKIVSTVNARLNAIANKPNGPPGMFQRAADALRGRPGPLAPAPIVFTQETSVFLGAKEVRAYYMGRGHTSGDAVVYFPALRTIHMGDLMDGPTPFIDYPNGGSLLGWIRILDETMKLDFNTVIPGHGPVTDKSGLLAYRNGLEKLRSRAAGLIREGRSPDESGKILSAEFGWKPQGPQMTWSLSGLLKELK